MVDTLVADVTASAPHVSAPAATIVTDRRRPGRLQNPSPELIALMRKPTDEAKRRVALYDAPNFVPQEREMAIVMPNPWHMARMAGAAGICVAGWAATVGVMLTVWG